VNCDLSPAQMEEAVLIIFISFMYLDLVLTLAGSLVDRTREANVLLGPLFKRSIILFWLVGCAVKTASVALCVLIVDLLPNAGLIIMCLLGGGAFSISVMNTVTIASGTWQEAVSSIKDAARMTLVRKSKGVTPMKVRIPSFRSRGQLTEHLYDDARPVMGFGLSARPRCFRVMVSTFDGIGEELS